MFFKRKPRPPIFPSSVPEGISLPSLANFRIVPDFFPRAKARRLLGRLAAYQREQGLAGMYVQTIVNHVAQSLVFAGELAHAEHLPDGDRLVLFLALIYAWLTPAPVSPLLHTLTNAQTAARELPRLGYTPAAAIRVTRAIKEYAAGDAVLKQRFLKALAAQAAAKQVAKLPDFLHSIVTGVMERQDDQTVLQRVTDAHSGGEAAIRAALYRHFADETVYPLPSTAERWEITDNFVGEPSLRRIRLYSVGSPGGSDYDFALVNVPVLKKRRIVVGSLELFINDSNAAAAIEARRTMDTVYRRRPKLYAQWLEDKAQARKLLAQGRIIKTRYHAFKARWHRARGLPHQHYDWKAGDDTPLPPELTALIPARGGGYNQIPLLLHDCIINPLPTLAAADWTQGKGAGDVLDILTGAVERMNRQTAKTILSKTIEAFETNRTGNATRVSL